MRMFLEPLQVPKLYLTAIGQRAELPWGSCLATGTCTVVEGSGTGSLEGSGEDPKRTDGQPPEAGGRGQELTGAPGARCVPSPKQKRMRGLRGTVCAVCGKLWPLGTGLGLLGVSRAGGRRRESPNTKRRTGWKLCRCAVIPDCKDAQKGTLLLLVPPTSRKLSSSGQF